MAKKRRRRKSLLPKHRYRGKIFTFRINKMQEDYLNAAQKIVNDTYQGKFKASKAWIILQLIEFGKGKFERKFKIELE